MKGAKSFALLITLVFLAGCGTPMTLPPPSYSFDTTVRSAFSPQDTNGASYVLVQLVDPSMAQPDILEFQSVETQIQRQLSARNMTRTYDPQAADFVVGFTAAYVTQTSSSAQPVYTQRERKEVEVRREVPRYNSRGEYVGTRWVTETEYQYVPSTVSHYEQQPRVSQHPVIVVAMNRSSAVSVANVDGELAIINTDPTPGSASVPMSHTEFPYFAIAESLGQSANVGDVAGCMANALFSSFPQASERRSVSYPDVSNCIAEGADTYPAVTSGP